MIRYLHCGSLVKPIFEDTEGLYRIGALCVYRNPTTHRPLKHRPL